MRHLLFKIKSIKDNRDPYSEITLQFPKKKSIHIYSGAIGRVGGDGRVISGTLQGRYFNSTNFLEKYYVDSDPHNIYISEICFSMMVQENSPQVIFFKISNFLFELIQVKRNLEPNYYVIAEKNGCYNIYYDTGKIYAE